MIEIVIRCVKKGFQILQFDSPRKPLRLNITTYFAEVSVMEEGIIKHIKERGKPPENGKVWLFYNNLPLFSTLIIIRYAEAF